MLARFKGVAAGGTLLAAFAAVAAIWFTAPPATAAFSEPADCPPVPRYVGDEFDGLPRHKQNPGYAHVGGRRLLIYMTSGPLITPDVNHVSASVDNLSVYKAPRLTARLLVFSLRPGGADGAVVGRARDHVEAKYGATLDVKLPKETPKRYRVELTLSRGGEVLAGYSDYVAMLKPRFDPRFVLKATTYATGAPIRGRLENFGSISLFYGPGFGLQRFDGTSWVGVPSAQTTAPAVAFGLPGGGVGRCETFEPQDPLQPGHYRATKYVESGGLSGEKRRHLSTVAAAEFDVVPG